MENIYSEEQKIIGLVKAKKETVDFLLNYSKSIQVVGHKKYRIEVALN